MGMTAVWRFRCDECGSTTYRMDSHLPKRWSFHPEGARVGLFCRLCAQRKGYDRR